MITLRAIEESDLGDIDRWRNSKSVFPYVREYRLLSAKDQEDWFKSYRESRRDSDWGQELMILNHSGFGDIGVGGFVRIEWRNRKAELSMYLRGTEVIVPEKGMVPSDYDPRTDAIYKEALFELFRYGFDILGFNKITWPLYGHDPKLGLISMLMVEEAVLHDEYFWDGLFHNRHYFSIFKSEFDKAR